VNDVLYWIGVLFYVYSIVLFVRMAMSWTLVLTQYRPTGVAAMAFEAVYMATDPPLRLLRRWVPPLNVGRVGIDMTFIVLAAGVWIVAQVLMG
jgi:YggT family protein